MANPFQKYKYKTPRKGAQYGTSQMSFMREYQKRRDSGGGRRKQAQALREAVMDWYNIMRHSVDLKLMVRFPKHTLLVKARMLQQEYLARSLERGYAGPFPKVDMKWLNGLLREYRVSLRKPNRKFKVPRAILADRLRIFWINVAMVRKLVLLHWGYDPHCTNVDQSPFHGNEAGSKESNTLALRGAGRVPLIENHKATRERWSLNSITDSNVERIKARLPGFELMFKAESGPRAAMLQRYAAEKRLPWPNLW